MSSSLLGLAHRYWLATLFGGLHLLFGGAAVAIQLLGAWDDMNPTMIVAVVFRLIDLPLFVLANAVAGPNAAATSMVVIIAVVGTIAWTLIGFVVQLAWRAMGVGYGRRVSA